MSLNRYIIEKRAIVVNSKAPQIFLGIFSLKRQIITARAGNGHNGWYLNAEVTSRRSSDRYALVIPHPGQEIPVRNFIGHPIPAIYRKTYKSTTEAMAGSAVFIFFMSLGGPVYVLIVELGIHDLLAAVETVVS